ncbi:MAG: hypothetical protein KatS3mg112_0621 [Thermogutta sp.]|nr:MAG: hypothetical protein KatS3mg112_0621 [Thermogutta sp.]
MSNLWKSCILFVSLATALMTIVACEAQKYPWGRDTRDSFGDGRFQIGRFWDGEEYVLVLMDQEPLAGRGIVSNVRNWEARGNFVFVVDEAGKCWKLNFRTGELVSYERVRDVSDPEERRLFERLMKKKAPVFLFPHPDYRKRDGRH